MRSELTLRLRSEKHSRSNKLNVRYLEISQKYMAQLSFLIKHQSKKLLEAERIASEKRKKLIEARREERKYERLKQRRQDDYNRELEKLLQKETDEFAGNIYMRKANTEGA